MKPALVLLLVLPLGGDLAGPLKYDRSGVELDGKRTAWKDVSSITEAERDAAKAREDYRIAASKPEIASAAETLVSDPFHKDSLKRLRPVLEQRPPSTALRPPFEGRWKAMPDTTGHHAIKAFALFALDFAGIDEKGKLFAKEGRALEDYVGFDRPVLAAADGEVLQVEDRFDDLPPRQLGKFDEANFVTIKHAEDEFTFYGHLHKGSATVKAGEKVTAGKVIGRVGNSGGSGMPHLHFTLLTPIGQNALLGWASVPWRLRGFTLVEAGGTACSVDARQARPQEGWILVAPKP